MYLEDMLEFCDAVLAYTAGQDARSLGADAMRLDATLRKLSLIGEAATRVPEAIRELAPDSAWRKIVAPRNRMIHAYQETEITPLWSIVSSDVPALRLSLQALLQRL